jgi:hypothetical protein
MVLPTKGNLPLQNRAGYNQGPQALSLTQIKFLGQPAIKCGAGDTVIFRNSPVVPGESNPRALSMIPATCGMIFNGTGGGITFELLLIDDQGNEFSLDGPNGLVNAEFVNLEVEDVAEFGLLCVPVDWSLVVRLSNGNPNSGRGVVVWPWAHDMGRNLVSIVRPVTTAGLEVGPPKGRAWQLAGNLFGSIGFEPFSRYVNFDSVERHVDEEIIILAGEEFITNIFNNTPQPITVSVGGVRVAWGYNDKAKGLILAYPDKIKMVARENQTSAPLYVSINFAEFDLPRDMG